MKLLLTSAGIKNDSIRTALVELLGRPIAESLALCVPTATYVMARGPELAYRFVTGQATTPMTELGWKSVGILELSALPSVDRDAWVPKLRQTDALLVNGGDPLYLCHWMRRSGLADLLPTLDDMVYVGLSAGSMVLAPSMGEDFISWRPPDDGVSTLGIVDFAIFPHLDHPDMPDNAMPGAERWAATMPMRSYAIDDQTAIQVVDGSPEVISEGHWRLFTP